MTAEGAAGRRPSAGGVGNSGGRRLRLGAHGDEGRQELERLTHIRDNLDLRLVARVHFGRREVDVDQAGMPRRIPAGRAVLYGIVAHGHDDIRLGKTGAVDVFGRQADGRNHERVVGGQGALGHERRQNRDLRALGQDA
jgi:hypothetical protein